MASGICPGRSRTGPAGVEHSGERKQPRKDLQTNHGIFSRAPLLATGFAVAAVTLTPASGVSVATPRWNDEIMDCYFPGGGLWGHTIRHSPNQDLPATDGPFPASFDEVGGSPEEVGLDAFGAISYMKGLSGGVVPRAQTWFT